MICKFKQVKMHFFRTIGFLMLLISGYSGNAFTHLDSFDLIDQDQILVDVSEDIRELSPSTLAGPNGFDSSRPLFFPLQNFSCQSFYTTRKANLYIIFSRTIDPALDVAEIIFPFHSFL